MADVLSALPSEGGARVGWTPVSGNTLGYNVRHSPTGAGTWTTVTDIPNNFVTLTGLDYTVTYDVQRQAIDGTDTSWSASVTVQPWIEPEGTFASLFRRQNVTKPTDLGDLGASYENDTWFAVIAIERIRLGAIQSLLGINANFGTADGLCGILIRMSDTDVLQALVVTGASSSVAIDSGANTFPAGKHVVAVEKSGTTVTLYDEDGNSIGSGSVTSATMDWTTSTSQRTTVNAHWATTVSPNLTGRNTGNVLDAIYVPGGVTSGERAALLRFFRESYLERPDTVRVELFLDSADIESDTTSGAALVALARQGQVLASVPASHRSGLSYADVHRQNDGSWRMWASALEYESGEIAKFGCCRFDSEDGVTWTEPNLGLIGSTGLLLLSTAIPLPVLYTHTVLRTAVSGEQFLFLFEVSLGASTTGAQFYGASNEGSAPAFRWSVNPGPLAFYNEGKAAVIRSDGRPLVFYNHGQGDDLRSVGVAIAESGGVGAISTYQDMGDLAALSAASSESQFYSAAVYVVTDLLWLIFVSKYNSTSETIHGDLYVSRDQGLTVTLIESEWLPLGAGGQFDDTQVYPCVLVRSGTEWRLFYVGHDAPHGSLEGSAIAYATVPFGRLAEVTA